MPAWTFDCVLGPGPGLSNGSTRAQVKIDLDSEHRLPLGPPILSLKVEGSSMCSSVMMSADKLRRLAKCLQKAADKYDELDANYDLDRAALEKKTDAELEKEFYSALRRPLTDVDRQRFAEDQRKQDEGFAELETLRVAYTNAKTPEERTEIVEKARAHGTSKEGSNDPIITAALMTSACK